MKECRPLLEEIGLKRAKNGGFRIDLGPGISGWFGIAHAYYPKAGSIILNLLVGIRDDGLEDALSRLLEGSGYTPRQAASVIFNIRTLTPEPAPALIEFRRDGISVAAHLTTHDARTWALPFMQRTVDCDALLDALLRYGSEQEQDFRVPLLHLLLGHHEEALRSVHEAEGRGRDDSRASRAYRHFASALRSELATVSAH